MLETEIVKLREAIEAMTLALVAKAPEQQAEPQVEQQAEPQAISFEMLKDATLKASRAGYKDAVRGKLSEMNVLKIQDLAPEQTIAFYNWLNTLVAK